MTEIPAWIKKGALVYFTFLAETVEVQAVNADGSISIRRARANEPMKAPLNQLKPATIEQCILFALDAQAIKEIKSILPEGKAEDQFRITFVGHISPKAIEKISAIVPDTFVDARLDGDAYIVTVKPSWLEAIVKVDPVTPAMLAQAEAEAAALKDQVAVPAVEDEELAETARIIKELRERCEKLQTRNEALAEQVDSLIQHIDGAAAQAEAVAEAAEMSNSVVPVTGCKQIVTKRNINDADLQKHINEGWEILHIQFGTDDILNVVFSRDQVAPAPTNGTRTSAKLIESSSPVVSFHIPQRDDQPVPAYPVNQVSPPRNYANISQDRVRLQAMLNDPDTTQYNFSLAVEKSSLSRQERNSLISQYRTHRTGEVLAAHMPPSPMPSPFKSLAEVSK